MKNKGLHKLSSYVHKENGCIVFVILTGSFDKNESIKRALFLADVEYEEDFNEIYDNKKITKEYMLKLSFRRYKQLEYIIPIINKKMLQMGITTKGYDFYYIDEECKRIFNE